METIDQQMSAQVEALSGVADTLTEGRDRRALLDLRQGFESWRVWWLLGIGDIRQRYRRSRIGQFWITLSIAIFVFAIGIVYAAIFQQPMAQYLPYLATTYI